MNHELSNNSEINTEKTEWDSIGDDVQFRNEQEPVDEVADFVDKRYGEFVDHMIDEACFDEGDRADLDSYVTNLSLEGIFTDEEQREMINSRARGESINPDLVQKYKDGLTEKIKKSSIADEIKRDPFLRARRVDNLAGRQRNDLNAEDENLKTLLWYTDNYFYNSGAAISLFGDKDYIKNTYNVEKIAENKKGIFNSDEQALQEKLTNNITGSIGYLLQTGQTSVKEIIDDPFLRKKHFDSLYEIETTGKRVDKVIADFWNNDEEFTDSIDYQRMMFEQVRNNPDIYKEIDEEEMDKLTDGVLEQLSEKKLSEIMRTYEKNPRKGDKLLAKELVPLLGLGSNPPALEYGQAKNNEGGYYSRRTHTVVICEENLGHKETDEQGNEEERVLKTSSIFGFLKPKKMEDDIFFRMGAVAHELWHAHQWAGENVDEDRREKYRQNFVYYVSGHSNYNLYRSQLIEAEAWKFGTKVENRFHNLYEQKKG